MYKKVLFRGDKRLQTRELLEIQEIYTTPDQVIGLRKGGFISLTEDSIYIGESLISIPTNKGIVTLPLKAQLISKEAGNYFLSLIQKTSRGTKNPLLGGPFVGSIGNDVVSTDLLLTKDKGDIHIFSISNSGKLSVKEFFYIKSNTNNTYSGVLEGLDYFIDSQDKVGIYPGKALIKGSIFELDKPFIIEPIDSRYIVYIGQLGIAVGQEEDLSLIYITSNSQTLYSADGRGIALLGKQRDPINGFLLYSVIDEKVTKLFSEEGINLSNLEQQILLQRRMIGDLYLYRPNTISRTSLNLRPDTSSDVDHPNFFSSFMGSKVIPFINDLSVRAMGDGLFSSSSRTKQYLNAIPLTNAFTSIYASDKEPSIIIKPNFIPSLAGVLPSSLSIEIKTKYLEPYTNYYLGLNNIPNYSSPLRSDSNGYLSFTVDILEEQIQPTLSISLWTEKEKIVESNLTTTRPLDIYEWPNTVLVGQRFILDKDLYLNSLVLNGISTEHSSNKELLTLYIADNFGKIITKTSNEVLDKVFRFNKPIRLDQGQYYFYLDATTETTIYLGAGTNSNHLIRRIGTFIEEDMDNSFSFYLLEAVASTEVSSLKIEKDVDINLDQQGMEIKDINDDRFLISAANKVSYIDLSNSFYLSSSFSYPSTWVSKLYEMGRPYKDISIEIESTSSDIEVYISPNHRDWDKTHIYEVQPYLNHYLIKSSYSYEDLYFNEDNLSTPRESLSVLIDINSYLSISRIELIIKR